nr:DUF1553 domain-containing protein [Saprospiraceae bacterium]
DWLASHFIEENTDIRELIRTIMTSRAYQLETRPVKEQAEDSDQFEGPLPRRLKAEQMLDAVSMVVDPIYHGVAFSEETDTIKPLWIWHREVEFDRTVLPKPGVRYLRKQMNLPAGTLIDAHLLVTADHAYTLFLDGKEIAKSNIWHEVTKVDLTESLSSGQEHVFAASVENAGSIPNPAGFLLTLKLRYADGRHHFIESDRSWLSTDSVQGTVWQENDYVDTSWTAAHAYGRLRSSHWGRPLAFNFSDREVPPYARAALVSLDPLSKSLGRPVRENVTTQRDDEASLLQTLTLTNSDFFHQSINNGAARMSLDAGSDRAIIEGVYRSILLRDPTWRERRAVMKIAKNGMDQEAVADLIWSLLLTPEFQFI